MQKQKKSVKDLIPPEGLFDARKLGIPRMLILGLQHMFAMFGATVLVPLILVNQYGLPMSIQGSCILRLQLRFPRRLFRSFPAG